MRYDKSIYFRKNGTETYNPTTGNYDCGEPLDMECMASVMDTKEETMHLIYGQIKQGSLTVQLQNHYNDSFDLIRIGEKLYSVDYKRNLRVKQIFLISEVQ